MKVVNKNIKVIVCHVNHGVRDNNKKEEEFVSDYVKKLGLTYFVMHIDSYKNITFSEEEARDKALSEEIEKKGYFYPYKLLFSQPKVILFCFISISHQEVCFLTCIIEIIHHPRLDAHPGHQRNHRRNIRKTFSVR